MTGAAMMERKQAPAKGDTLVEKFQKARDGVRGSLIERDEEVDLMFVALLAGEHCCFRGDAGTAKSMMIDNVVGSIAGAEKFDILMSKFTDPVEMEGPLVIDELLKGNYVRRNETYATTAHIIFVDEVFKASSAILNTTLKLINEKKYRNGGRWHPSPLISVFGASNEWPVGDSYADVAQAFFDRFLIRKDVSRVGSPKGLADLMFGGDDKFDAPKDVLSINEVQFASALSMDTDISAVAVGKIAAIIRELNGAGIHPGDRRLRKSVKACRAAAWLAGSQEVQPQHLSVLAHTLWDHPDKARETAKIVDKIADPDRAAVGELRGQAVEILANIDKLFGGSSRIVETQKMQDFMTQCAKLEDIGKRLKALGSSPAINQAVKWAATEIRRVRMKSQGLDE